MDKEIEKRPVGRPKKHEYVVKTDVVKVRFSAVDVRRLRKMSAKTGRSMSEIIRSLVVDELKSFDSMEMTRYLQDENE